jgi:hypothetical protein
MDRQVGSGPALTGRGVRKVRSAAQTVAGRDEASVEAQHTVDG